MGTFKGTVLEARGEHMELGPGVLDGGDVEALPPCDDLVDELVQGDGRPSGEDPPCPDEMRGGQIVEIDARAHGGLAREHVRAAQGARGHSVDGVETLRQVQVLERGDRACGDDAAHAASFGDQRYTMLVVCARAPRAEHVDG